MPDFNLPDLGEGLTDAEIVAWHVAVGDRVEIDQPVVEVETAKAVVEVPVPFAGTVAELHGAPGTTVAVGAPLISITAEAPATRFHEPGVVAPVPAAAADDEGSGSVLVGYGTALARPAARRGTRRRTAPPATAPSTVAGGPVPVISPLVRKLARDAGLDLTGIAGTGPAGLVRRRDVEQAIRRAATVQAARTSATATPVTAAPPKGFDGMRIPLRGTRRAVAERLTRSRREIPEATVWVDVDATNLLAARAAINARTSGAPVSLLALLARFTVLGLRRYPELNSRVEPDEIVVPDHIHLGFAAQTERGLVVPVVPNAHSHNTRDLSTAIADLTAAARAGTLAPADLTGGTFTVNNYGVFGVDGSAAIINHPEVAILGMGRIIDRPWVVDGALVVRKITQLALAFDHRACDGGTAGGFLRYVADCVESPVAALGDL